MTKINSKELMNELLSNTISNYEDDIYDSSDLISTLLSLEKDYGVKGISILALGVDENAKLGLYNNVLSIGEILEKYYDCEIVDDDLITIFYNILDDYSLLTIQKGVFYGICSSSK